MKSSVHYATVSEAIEKLRIQGFKTDFHVKNNKLVSPENEYALEDFKIVDTYRYEGNSDPGDEATVYAIESKKGVKGILVAGYGGSSNSIPFDVLAKLTANKRSI